jgi:hypothetical protein
VPRIYPESPVITRTDININILNLFLIIKE